MPMNLPDYIRHVKDFPKPGIVFRDITPLLADADALAYAVEAMALPFADRQIDIVAGAESRGFIFGTAIARYLHCGFIPIRKPGKLPAEVIAQEYTLEYGTDKIEIHADAVKPGQKILMVDDLLATGGTMKACCDLIERLKGDIVGISFLIDLAFLNGRQRLKGHDIHSEIVYDSE